MPPPLGICMHACTPLQLLHQVHCAADSYRCITLKQGDAYASQVSLTQSPISACHLVHAPQPSAHAASLPVCLPARRPLAAPLSLSAHHYILSGYVSWGFRNPSTAKEKLMKATAQSTVFALGALAFLQHIISCRNVDCKLVGAVNQGWPVPSTISMWTAGMLTAGSLLLLSSCSQHFGCQHQSNRCHGSALIDCPHKTALTGSDPAAAPLRVGVWLRACEPLQKTGEQTAQSQ